MIVSTTLTGSNADIIGDALRSVIEHVDVCLVIDTGAKDDTLDVARAVAGDKLRVVSFPWCNDFAAARNFSLDAAADIGGTWAVTVDTDERLHWGDIDLHNVLEASTADALLVAQADGTYAKQRVFRLPAKGRWRGPTHECFGGGEVSTQDLPGVTFSELRKNGEGLRHKFERDLDILKKHTSENPSDPRWFFYLGDTLRNLGRADEAAEAYEACAALRGWDEEAAWALFRAAEIYCARKDFVRSIEACGMGLARHPGIAELAWLAGYASFQRGWMLHAVHWSTLSLSMGMFEGHAARAQRIGFRHLPALFEGPYDVLRFALRRLGRNAEADEAEAKYLAAKKRREETYP